MKIFIFLLIIAAFLQSSFVSINLVLILLIAKSLAIPEKENLMAGFTSGILIGLLQTQNIGFWALIFLLVTKITSLAKNLPFSKNILTILIVSAVAILVVHGLEVLYFKKSFESPKVIWEILLSVPCYFMLIFWDERFVVKPDSRLKLRN